MIRSSRKQHRDGEAPEEGQSDPRSNEIKRKSVKKKDTRPTPRDSHVSKLATVAKPVSSNPERADISKHTISELTKLLDKSRVTTKPLQTMSNCDKDVMNPKPQTRPRDKKATRKPVGRYTETSVSVKSVSPEIRPALLTPPSQKRTPGVKKDLVIVSIFKNEAVAIREWIVHHMWQGVAHFYMIDNGSTDNWQEQVDGLPVTIVRDDERHQQAKHYNQYFLDQVYHILYVMHL